MSQTYEQLLTEIKKLLENDTSNFIAIISVVVAILALIITIVFNLITHKQYIDSLSPQLTFKLFEQEHILFLSVKNTGKSAATNISIDIKAIHNNGTNNILIIDNLFKSKFMLYPEESVQGRVAISGKNISTDTSPIIDMNVSYFKTNNKETEQFIRTVSFSNEPKVENTDIEQIANSIESIMYSENRIANHLEGRTLYVFDRINSSSPSSLYKDLKDAVNNIERGNDSQDNQE